ncbi:MAG: S8 family serine peptidase [Armatimonadetes bacterium]|nr:S8 family serine peptidase [Armatimonadota bacterium]
MMRHTFLKSLLSSALSLAGGALLLTSAPAAAQSAFLSTVSVPNEVMVGVNPELGQLALMNIEASVGRVIEYLPALKVARVRLYGGLDGYRAATFTSRLAGVSFVEPNYVLTAYQAEIEAAPNDPGYATQQWALPKVQADRAWPLWSPKASTVIAIVDTGVAMNHPDLANKIYRNAGGQVIGYDFINGDADPTDDNGHGTHCSGIAAGQVNNGVGMAGVAGWSGGPLSSDTNNTKIMPIKVLGANGSGSLSAVASGITFAADNGAKVINLSLGSTSTATTLANAVAYAWGKGCVVVAAAGNSGSSTMSYPAAYPNVISVAATDNTDKLASFSNFSTWVLCAAPGVGIYSSVPGGGYASWNGTSMAAPLVAGEVALLASHAPNLSNAALRDFVLNNTDPLTAYTGRTIKGGRVNVYKAIFAISSLPATPTNLSAKAKSRTQITLTWTDSSTNEKNFVLERSLDNITFTTVATLAAGVKTFTNSALVANKLYYYRLRARNVYGFSEYSNTTSATTLP